MNGDQFAAHGLWATLDDFKGIISGDLTSEDESSRDSIRRLHAVAAYLDSLRGLDSALVDAASLDQVNSDLTQARDYLNTYVQDTEANAGILGSVDTTLTSALDNAVRTLPAPPADSAAEAAQEAASRYKDAMDAEVGSLRGQVAELKQQLVEAGEQRAADSERANESLAELQAKITESDQQVATQTTQLQEQIETQRTSFTEETELRESAFKESEATRETAAKEARDSQANEAGVLIADLHKKRDQAAALLDATNRDVVSGDYRGWASKQASAAFWWTVTTVLLGLVTVGALVAVVLTAENDSVQFLLSKSTVGIIGLIIAGYAARQAAEHRREERTANRLALDLAALEPFLEHVENPEALRSEIAKRVFVPERTSENEPRFSVGRRGMTLAELLEFAKVLQKPPE